MSVHFPPEALQPGQYIARQPFEFVPLHLSHAKRTDWRPEQFIDLNQGLAAIHISTPRNRAGVLGRGEYYQLKEIVSWVEAFQRFAPENAPEASASPNKCGIFILTGTELQEKILGAKIKTIVVDLYAPKDAPSLWVDGQSYNLKPWNNISTPHANWSDIVAFVASSVMGFGVATQVRTELLRQLREISDAPKPETVIGQGDLFLFGPSEQSVTPVVPNDPLDEMHEAELAKLKTNPLWNLIADVQQEVADSWQAAQNASARPDRKPAGPKSARRKVL